MTPPDDESVVRKSAETSAWSARDWSIAACLFVGVMVVYGRVLGFDFLTLDDGVYVYENPFVLRGVTKEGIQWAFSAVHANYWLPLTWLSFMVDAHLFGTSPSGFHATNLALHAINASLLFLFLRRATRSHWMAAFVAVVFAFHPTRLEVVAWVTSRKDLLSTLFGLVALLSYLRYTSRRSWPAYAAVFLAFFASLLCKVTWISLPFLLLLLDYWPLGRCRASGATNAASGSLPCPWNRLVLEKLPLFALAAAAAVWTSRLHPLADVPADAGSFVTRTLQAGANYGRYLVRAFAAPDVSLAAYTPPAPYGLAAVVCLILGALTLYLLVTSRPAYLKVGWLWFLAALAPVIGIVNNGGTEIADRFLYVSLIGPALALGGWLDSIRTREDWRAAVARCVAWLLAIAMIGVTTARLPRWKNSTVRFSSILAKDPANANAWNALGRSKELRGELLAALSDYERALAHNPRLTYAAVNRANILVALDRTQEAVEQLQIAGEWDPTNARLQSNLGVCLFRVGRQEEGLRRMKASLAMDPYLLDTRYNLALALAQTGDRGEARAMLEELLFQNPADRAGGDLLREMSEP